MKTFGRSFLLIGLLTLLGVAALWPPERKIKLGIDLSGGTILVYQALQGGTKDLHMDELVTALKRRINPQGTQDIIVRHVGSNRVEIILPRAEDEEVEEIKRRMTAVGSMQFRILADRRDAQDAQAIPRALAAGGLNTPPPRYAWAKLAEIVDRKAEPGAPFKIDGNRFIDPRAAWEPDRYAGATLFVSDTSPEGATRSVYLPILANDVNSVTVDPKKAFVREAGGREQGRPLTSLAGEFREVDAFQIVMNPSRILEDPNLAIRSVDRGNGIEERYVLHKIDTQNVTGDMLSVVRPDMDPQFQPAVGFEFNPAGASKFGRLTREYAPGRRGGDFRYHLAILLDDLVMSAPVINQEISNAGIIEGMPLKQRDDLIEILRAGKLPTSINPIPLQEENIGPTLGRDTIEKGLRAIFISMFVVPVFMILYYRFSGVVAVLALVLNMILLVGSMAFTNSSFTLPGLAGLALTIGMAVDANVLIFERMREEAERGANLSTQIRNGFNRAWSTILDSNVTTMLSGMVLWAIGTEEIKGFALTLIIGLVWNLFTAVFVSRVVFEFAYKKGWIKKLSMMKLMDKTNIDFVRPRRILMTISVVIIGIGLASFFMQGRRGFNIDFTGGTLVTVQLNPASTEIQKLDEGDRAEFVRDLAGKSGLPDVSVESLKLAGEERGTRFNIRTTQQDAAAVQKAILAGFGDKLARLSVDIGPAEPISADSGAPGDAAAARFAGGSRYTIGLNRDVDPDKVRQTLTDELRRLNVANPESRFDLARVREPGSTQPARIVVRTNLDPPVATQALDALKTNLPNDPALNFQRLENFGAAVAGDTQLVAMIAIITSWLAIIAYLWFRFKSVTFGLAAVIALVHDVLIALGAVSISPYKIDLPMIAAFLTIIGFSVNDTIVIFDRIREIKGKSPYLTEGIINAAVNQTLSRTLLTSFTALLVVLIMYLFGGEALQGFSFCLLVGFISGIYSTVYIASPILIEWMGRKDPKSKGVKGTSVAAASR